MIKKSKINKVSIGIASIIILVSAVAGGAIADRLFGIRPLDKLFPRSANTSTVNRVTSEESVVTDVVKKASPSVVTVSATAPAQRVLQFNPISGFQSTIQGGTQQDIGTGFIVSADGLIVTNKHVVSDSTLTYKVIANDGTEYDIKQINQDPSNDIAVIKIDASGLTPITLGNSDNIQIGQLAITIGTALGEYRNTVTTGVVSGLGRGITAGNPLEGYVEKLDDVIQTDAAINPGNSGGPLLNSSGEVVGINVAVAQGAQNIGFAIPINVVKESLNQFQTTGKFAAKPYLGVSYQMISKQSAILNEVPQGIYVVDIISGSPAEVAGLQPGDIITKIDGKAITDDSSLSDIISSKKPGDKMTLEIYRDGKTQTITATVGESQ